MGFLMLHPAPAAETVPISKRLPWRCLIRGLLGGEVLAVAYGRTGKQARDLAKLLALSFDALEIVKLLANGDPRAAHAASVYLSKVPGRYLGAAEEED